MEKDKIISLPYGNHWKITIEIDAYEEISGIDKVEIYIDGVLKNTSMLHINGRETRLYSSSI